MSAQADFVESVKQGLRADVAVEIDKCAEDIAEIEALFDEFEAGVREALEGISDVSRLPWLGLPGMRTYVLSLSRDSDGLEWSSPPFGYSEATGYPVSVRNTFDTEDWWHSSMTTEAAKNELTELSRRIGMMAQRLLRERG